MKSCVLSSKIKVSQFPVRVASGARWGWAPFWKPFGLQMAPAWHPKLPRQLQDASYTPPGPPQHLPRHLQDRPQRAQDVPGLSKSLQDGSKRLQDVSKSSPEEVFEAPSRLQELEKLPKTSAFALQPLVSGLQAGPAGSANRKQSLIMFECGL